MKNLTVPLPEDVYASLIEAERSNRPATSIAREAIEAGLRGCQKAARHQAIAEFARDFAGTELDLDPQLEAAGYQDTLATTPEAIEACVP